MERYYVSTDGLAVGYGERVVVEDVCLRVRRGEIMTLIGPNGSGKSTILKSLIRQLEPTRGTVYLDGRDMLGMTEQDIATRMSVLMTERVRPELMTCWEVAATGRYPYTGRLGLLTEEDRRAVRESLALVNALELSERAFSQISDGQRQRVLLARALCQEPEVMVLDEPTSFLDIRHKLELLTILKELVRSRRLAVIMSLHELELAQKISDCVVCVRNGAIERCGTPEEIFSSDYILSLYGAEKGSYNSNFGCLELPAVQGEPQVFVIGGGGSGIALYRRLQRAGIPFAAGVLHENDVDYEAARALAAVVVTERAFEPIGEASFERALRVLRGCARAVCCLKAFGTMNERNRLLAERAAELGLLAEAEEIFAPRESPDGD